MDNVRLIDEEGNQVGIVGTDKALEMAYAKDLDLVLMSDNPNNPVARMIDYGKFTYEQSKREREARKNQQITNLKKCSLN